MHTNKLASESSPYLLQHARNPVDWYPWGEEALNKAQAEDKLLIISIGYAACHWCHVMEHESFEDTAVAAFMNEHFVSIKVDREERPDIDDVYMTACQMASGRGCGWPLNAFALPDGRPIWASTYFPKEQWMRVLGQFAELRENEPEKLISYAEQLTAGFERNDFRPLEGYESEFSLSVLDTIAGRFVANVDGVAGGRAGAPKFPMPNNWEFLMRYAHTRKNEHAKRAVLNTLDNMANGGIYDQIGGGFARYSVDAQWHVPHFEKMLYDNGQLVSLYAKAYQWSGDERYRHVVQESLSFIKREMTDPSGGFYSSLDADSEGEEGKFYVWTIDETELALETERQFEIAMDYFDIRPSGNWEHGKNVLQITKTEQALALKHGLTVDELMDEIAIIKQTLLEKRAERVRPGLDDKILTSWNALMMTGYIDAYRAFGNTEYLEEALKNAAFIESNMLRNDGGLNRNYKDGKSVINAFLDDYAALCNAWIALYQVTYDEKWLNHSRALADYAVEHFFDEETGLFFYTSDIDPPLVARRKEVGDNVIPASNSMMAKALHDLGLYFYENRFWEMSENMLRALVPSLEQADQPSFYSNWCDLYLSFADPVYEIAIVGPKCLERTAEMMREYIPNALFLGGEDEGNLELLKMKLQEGKTVIYVCQDKVCQRPVEDSDDALEQIAP